MLPFLVATYAAQVYRIGFAPWSVDAPFLVFVALFLLVAIAGYAVGVDERVALPDFSVIAQFLAMFITFKFLAPEEAVFRRWCLACHGFMTAAVFASVQSDGLLVAASGLWEADSSRADYQQFAFAYLIVAFVASAFSRSIVLRCLVYATALPALYLNGARSEFVAFPIGILLIELSYARRRLAFLGAWAVVLAIVATTGAALLDDVPETRILALGSYDSDQSVVERRAMLGLAWETVADNPILGAYASYPPGEYAHNALSAWVDLGLLGFVLFAGLLVAPLSGLVVGFRARGREPGHAATMAMFGMAVVLYAFAKGFKYQLLPIALGLYSRYVLVLRPRQVDQLGPAEHFAGKSPGLAGEAQALGPPRGPYREEAAPPPLGLSPKCRDPQGQIESGGSRH